MTGPLFGLCYPGSDEANLYADCPTFEAWLGSFLAHMLVFGLVLWVGYVILRLLWIAHTYTATAAYKEAEAAAKRAMEVHLKYAHGGAKLYEAGKPTATEEDRALGDRSLRREIALERERINALVGDLQALKDKLGDPDNGLDSQAVPCTRGERGRWLKAWVPFWP